MTRRLPSNAFRTQTARKKQIPEDKEVWTVVDEGIYLGYRRGKTKSTWYVRYYLGAGKYQQKTIGLADDYRGADGDDVLDFFQAYERAKTRGTAAKTTEKPAIGRQGYTVEMAAEDYLDNYKSESDKQTKEIRRVIDRYILPILGNRQVASLTAAELKKWRNNLINQKAKNRGGKVIPHQDVPEHELKRRRKATAQRKWNVLSAVLNHAFSNDEAGDVIPTDAAWRRIKPLRNTAPPPPERMLSITDCQTIVDNVEPKFRPIGLATILTGGAFKELREAKVKDYMKASGHLRLANTKRRQRLVPLTTDGQNLFDRLTEGRREDDWLFVDASGEAWKDKAQHRRLRRASEAAAIFPPVTLTELRHAYGSILLNAGVKLEVVSKAMGHASTATTAKHYAHLLQGTVDDAIRGALPRVWFKDQK